MCELYSRDLYFFFFFKQKTAYEMRISDWSSDVCSSDLHVDRAPHRRARQFGIPQIAFEIEDLGIGDPCLVDHRLIEQVARAEKGVHRALPIGGDEDQADRKSTRLNSRH